MTNNVYKSLQDNNEDQCIVMLGESSSGKTENCRMIIRFLSKISGRFMPLQRQRSSNSIGSYKSCSPKSSCSTPKHKSSTSTLQHSHEKSTSSCFKTIDGSGRNKKISRVEFDFSKCSDTNDITEERHDMIKYCPKHNCCNVSSSSSTTSNPIDIPLPRRNKTTTSNYHPHHHHSHHHTNELPAISKSFTIYETMNRVHNSKKVPNCLDHYQSNPTVKETARCESLDIISNQNHSDKIKLTDLSSSFDETIQQLSKLRSSSEKNSSTSSSSSHVRDSSYNRSKINLDNFKSAKRKVPIKNLRNFQLTNLEIQTMKERIAQAEVFLEAMGNALTFKNRDSSRYVSHLIAVNHEDFCVKLKLGLGTQGLHAMSCFWFLKSYSLKSFSRNPIQVSLLFGAESMLSINFKFVKCVAR